jgi:hypothetical protein
MKGLHKFSVSYNQKKCIIFFLIIYMFIVIVVLQCLERKQSSVWKSQAHPNEVSSIELTLNEKVVIIHNAAAQMIFYNVNLLALTIYIALYVV